MTRDKGGSLLGQRPPITARRKVGAFSYPPRTTLINHHHRPTFYEPPPLWIIPPESQVMTHGRRSPKHRRRSNPRAPHWQWVPQAPGPGWGSSQLSPSLTSGWKQSDPPTPRGRGCCAAFLRPAGMRGGVRGRWVQGAISGSESP
jgi:hypothetical protein